MLAFITSLRHPRNSDDYGRVEALLAQTLASVSRQTAPYRVWVVGNRRPRDLPAGVTWVPVDFDAPSTLDTPRTGVAAVLRDKGTKLATGLLAASRRALGRGSGCRGVADRARLALGGGPGGDPRPTGFPPPLR